MLSRRTFLASVTASYLVGTSPGRAQETAPRSSVPRFSVRRLHGRLKSGRLICFTSVRTAPVYWLGNPLLRRPMRSRRHFSHKAVIIGVVPGGVSPTSFNLRS